MRDFDGRAVTRADGREPGELRPVSIEPRFMPHAEGSCLIRTGNTAVVCTATVVDEVPRWMSGENLGWVAAEYSLLPRSTSERTPREVHAGRPRERTVEIQRLIGRALRAAIDLGGLGRRTILLDCDVLHADGGTRTAAVTGSYVALHHAVEGLRHHGKIDSSPLLRTVAAVSVGVLDGEPCLDLTHEEDSASSLDMNVVMTGDGDFVEIQGIAEHGVFDHPTLERLLELAARGITTLAAAQQRALA